jgi:hypothetical protein
MIAYETRVQAPELFDDQSAAAQLARRSASLSSREVTPVYQVLNRVSTHLKYICRLNAADLLNHVKIFQLSRHWWMFRLKVCISRLATHSNWKLV